MPRVVRSVPPLVWTAAALAALLAFNALAVPGFFDLSFREGRLVGSLIDVLDRAAPVMVLALGMTLVIATGGVDLSVGAIMAISGAVAAVLLTRHGAPAGVAIGGALGAGLAGGVWNGALVALLGVQPIVATLVLMLAGRGVAQLLTEGQIVTFRNPTFEWAGNGVWLTLPVSVWVVAFAGVVLSLVARLTGLGLAVEATGDNAGAARRAGVRTGAMRIVAYSVCGLCAGVAGVLAAADIRAAAPSSAGLYLELDAIVAVVLGGTALSGGRFSLAGSVVGALLLQALHTTLLTLGVEPARTPLVKGAAVLLVCLLHSPQARRLMRGWGGRR